MNDPLPLQGLALISLTVTTQERQGAFHNHHYLMMRSLLSIGIEKLLSLSCNFVDVIDSVTQYCREWIFEGEDQRRETSAAPQRLEDFATHLGKHTAASITTKDARGTPTTPLPVGINVSNRAICVPSLSGMS